MQIASFLFT